MKYTAVVFFILVLVWSGCNEKEKENAVTPDALPYWVSDFPAINHGAVSADLLLQTSRPAKVYWVITEEGESYSGEQIKSISEVQKEHGITGNTTVRKNEPVSITVTELEENTAYTAYLVAQSTVDESLDPEVKQIDFTTHGRQDTLAFQSVAENRTVNYLLYRPEAVFKNPNEKYPIAFFMAGYGEVATEQKPIAVINNGSLAEYIYKGNDVPMIVMTIQHTRENWNTTLIHEAMDHALVNYPVDENRFYRIGMSGGAYGSWAFAQQAHERLAAMVAISGLGDPEKACNLKNLAVWGFHNAIDEIVHPGKTTSMINALQACNPTQEVKLQLFPDEGHNAWRRVFDPDHDDWRKSPDVPRIDLYNWLLDQRKSLN